ncbi:MAG: iron-containing alcohol dehydrogenase [Pirellulaceae bacterium]
MRTTWNFSTAGQLTYGIGAVNRLPEICLRRRWSRVLIVTDRLLCEAGVVERVAGPLRSAGVEVELFDGGEPEPSLAVVLRASERARGAQPTALIGIGGGSNLDLAKLTAVLYAHGGTPADYFGFDRVPGPVAPLVCVPTTAGTGSEVSHAAVVTDAEQRMKISTLSQYLRPAVAIVDPQLTYSCPRKVTADAGIDALAHAVEAYTATDFSELETGDGEALAYEGRYALGMGLAEQALRLIGRNLVRAVEEPADTAARDAMSLAATLAGMAFSNCGVALVHALEYPLGGELHCSHGAGNGLLLPHVMRFNLPARREAIARIGILLSGDEATAAEDAEGAIAAVERICRAIGIPARIRDLGGRPEQLAGFADKSFAIKRLLAVNPRQASRDDLLAILQGAY